MPRRNRSRRRAGGWPCRGGEISHQSGRRTVAAHARRGDAVSDLHWLTATAIAKAFAERSLSPTELMKALLQRIEMLQPRLHAFIRLDADAAMDAAKTAEQELAIGHVRGPLHGIPVGIKDIIDVADVLDA